MEPLASLNSAMQYIEANLTDELDFRRVAQLAGCSEYHFRRMFSFLAGMSLGDYIRRRRLSMAAIALQHSEARVLDVAVLYGYTSADAFSRAFQAFHGINPSEVRQADAQIKVLPPMTFRLSIQGGHEMNYRIVEKPAFYIIGIHERVTLQYEGVNPQIAAMWQSLTPDDFAMLKALSNTEPQGLVSASLNFTDNRADGSQLDQWIGVATDSPTNTRWQSLAVEAGTWAVFTVRGNFPDALQNTWGRIYAEWFPTSGYEARPAPEMLWNEGKDTTKPDYHSEIWIPVRKR